MELEVAVPHWLAHINKLNTQLSGSAFLGGSTPNILDFSTYHCCWLVYSNPLLEPELEAFPDVARWMKEGYKKMVEAAGVQPIFATVFESITYEPVSAR